LTHTDQPTSNAFQDFLLTLRPPSDLAGADLWTQGTVDALQSRNPDGHHFPFVQLFEAHVVDEVALLSGADPALAAVLGLENASPWASSLRQEFDSRQDLSGARAVNLAYVLISISRSAMAEGVLAELSSRALSPIDRLECLFAQWLTDNRRSGTRSRPLFSAMRDLISNERIPDERQIEVCTQAAVWFAKRKDVSERDLAWFLVRGEDIVSRLASQPHPPPTVLSSWYRGIAMLQPEDVGGRDVSTLMRRAAEMLDGADESRIHARIIRRTFLQSTLKQYCYSTPDADRAAAAADELIASDRTWSENWADVAQMHMRFGHPEAALDALDRAVTLGPPYVRFHLRSSAALYASLGRREEATARYLALADIGTLPAAIAREALEVASSADASELFRRLAAA
jgi:tetratricopeptide (TPR) repeat protein